MVALHAALILFLLFVLLYRRKRPPRPGELVWMDFDGRIWPVTTTRQRVFGIMLDDGHVSTSGYATIKVMGGLTEVYSRPLTTAEGVGERNGFPANEEE